jgi:DNA-binding NarL/FixJ family response regulator
VVRFSLQRYKKLLEADFEILASAANGDEALQFRSLRPDILVLDLRMPGKHRLMVLRK